MSQRISEAVHTMLETDTPIEIADKIEVSSAMVSTWRNKENDFTPRLPVAMKIYANYSIEIWPYSLEALQGF